MSTMSDDGDKTCPLCAEEMDLTDQQLKPCKCGYEICVWCWHHIIEMAEKEGSEGRCPACRTPYDKERIVGMAANCERVVVEMSAERKQKSQRGKPKASAESRKHLNGVRVIKRNLVYIIGLPSYLADESILGRKEYFGQYGKVLKVSISRPTNVAITAQQASNSDTFSVYITYAREDEAIKCIHAVHNYVLEGKPLRACFGTTKYCQVWLRNMTCTNPDCLYLHDVGGQEDSFTKDEIISAYTRSRVPQSSSNNLQMRSGHALPPPIDDSCNNGAITSKSVIKSAPSNMSTQIKGSTNVSKGGRSTVLPAAASWGSRVSNCRPSAASMSNSPIPFKQKAEPNSSCSLSPVVSGTKQTSSWHDDDVTPSKVSEGRHALHKNNVSRLSDPLQSDICKDFQTTSSNVSSMILLDEHRTCKTSAWDDGDTTLKIPEGTHLKGRSRSVDTVEDNVLDGACKSAWDDDEVTTSQVLEGKGMIHVDGSKRSSETMKPGVNRDHLASMPDMSWKAVKDASISSQNCSSSSSPLASFTKEDRHITPPQENTRLVKAISSEAPDRISSSYIPDKVSNGDEVCRDPENICSGLASINIGTHLGANNSCLVQHQSYGFNDQLTYPSSVIGAHTSASNESVKAVDALAADAQIQGVPNHSIGVINEHLPVSISNQPSNILQNNDAGSSCILLNEAFKDMYTETDKGNTSLRENTNGFANAGKEDSLSNSDTEKEANYLRRFDDVSNFGNPTSVHTGENSIITDILSLDFDPWDDSLSSTNNFAKLLGEIDKQEEPTKLPTSWKLQTSNQSRFAFARQEDEQIVSDIAVRDPDNAHDVQSSSPPGFYGDSFQYVSHNSNLDTSIGVLNNHSVFSSDAVPGFARGKVSAPPGFQAPNRAPPPGFSSHDRYGQSYEPYSENHLLGNSFPNQYQVAGNANDVEFFDPAILAVGKGILPLGANDSVLGSRLPFPSQFSADDYTRFHLLQQQSAHQNLQIPEQIGDRFSSMNDAYISSGTDDYARHHLLKQQSAHQNLRLPEQLGDRFSHLNDAYISSTTDEYTRLHLLKQQSNHQNLQIPDQVGDRFSPLTDAYISSRLSAQHHSRQSQFAPILQQHPRGSHMLGSQWDGWNNMLTGNDMSMAEILRNDKFGLNGYYPVNEEHMFHRAGAADLYNRAFGM